MCSLQAILARAVVPNISALAFNVYNTACSDDYFQLELHCYVCVCVL